MTDATKRRAIIFLILAALITVLLAAAMPQLKLQQGIPLPAGNKQQNVTPQTESEPTTSVSVNTFLETVMVLFVLMVTIYMIVKRGQRIKWRELIRPILGFAVLSLSLALILYAFSQIKVVMGPPGAEVLPPQVAAVQVGPPLAPLPASLLWIVWILMAGLVLGLVILSVRARVQRKATQRDLLALEAEQAAEAIKAGQDFSNVIIRCYEQMSAGLKKEQGLTLDKAMTAREFEALLAERGVPDPPVRQLTRLFEIARYAAQTPGPAEEAQAIDCLNAIAQYSSKKGPGQPK